MAVTKLYTIGYEKVGQADFVAALKAAKVKTLVDVREVANSRRAGFAKKSLAAALDEAGIAYVHMKALGTPKLGREAESQMALSETADLAKNGRTCIMCLEHDWHGCHRAIVARHIEEEFGIKPEHLSPEPR